LIGVLKLGVANLEVTTWIEFSHQKMISQKLLLRFSVIFVLNLESNQLLKCYAPQIFKNVFFILIVKEECHFNE